MPDQEAVIQEQAGILPAAQVHPPILQHVPLPSKLEFQADGSTQKSEWESFKQIWNNYEISSQLADHPAHRRTATLLTCFSPSALKVYNSLPFENEGDKTDITKVLELMTDVCTGTVNETYERYVFNTRVQGASEGIDAFYASLLELSTNCSYGDLTQSLIRDRIVVGVRDQPTRKRLLYERGLDLKKCLEIARSFEATRARISSMETKPEAKADFVKSKKFTRKPDSRKPNSAHQQRSQDSSNNKNCQFCGNKEAHARKNCPASDAKCYQCQKRGHFGKMCKKFRKKDNGANKSANAGASAREVVYESGDDDDVYFLGAVSKTSQSDAWTKQIAIDGDIALSFKVDTGADVNILPYRSYQKYFEHKTIFPAKAILQGADGSKLPVLGYINCKLYYMDSKVDAMLYVVKASCALLSRDTSIALGIVKLVGSVEKFPQLFKGLGTMSQPYHIELKPNATPFAVRTPRRMSLPLMPRVKQELQRLQDLNIIRPVDEPTEWCAPIVPVPKRNGQEVRICVDFRKLNEAVKRELHMLPSVDQVLGQMGDAKVFSKLDANNGFHQIKLTSESQLLTTFITPYGRYCYQRLPFGINSAPEHYQKQIQKVVGDLQGVACLMDDIVVFGKDENEHNQRLNLCMKRLADAGVTLNKSKCDFNKTEISFLGHVVGQHGIKLDRKKTMAIQDLEKPHDVKGLR